MGRFIVECTWSGYKPGNEKVCHRTVIGTGQAVALQRVHAIRFDDGTYMSVAVRRKLPREQVTEIHGYDSVLENAWHRNKSGTVHVGEL